MKTATGGEIRVRCGNGGESFVLVSGSELGAGGQATVYPVPERRDVVAKVYHEPTAEQERRVRLMLAHRPAGASTAAGGGVFAWPLDLLHDDEGRFTGVLLPRVDGKLRVFELYNPATRRERAPLFHHGLLHRAARNLAAAFHGLHEAGFVVGDVNESNVLVGEDGRVVLIDTDSFQVRDPAGGPVCRCPVGRPEFTPPELRERSFAETDRTPEHDRFGLGVLVFQMLMEGTHPFAGRYRGEGEPPSVQERIAAGHFPYAGRAGVPLEPARTAPPLAVLDPALRALLARCFVDGHRDPAARPTAAEWRDVLASAEGALVACGRNEQHRFGRHLDRCPWCERARRLEGRDPFPSEAAVRRGEHRRRAVPARQPPRRDPAVPRRPRFQAIAQTGNWKLAAPPPYALLAVAFLVAMLGIVSAALPPLPVALAAGGLIAAARRLAQPGTIPRLAIVLTLLLVGAGFLGGDGASARMEIGQPEPYLKLPEVGTAVVAMPPVAFAYAPEALDRRPVLQDTARLFAAIASLPFQNPGADGEPLSILRFVVDERGQVDMGTVHMTPGPGANNQIEFQVRLESVRFNPGEYEGHPVRTAVTVPLRWAGGLASPALADATWNPGTENPSPVVDRPEGPSPVAVADAELKPQLLNTEEVQSVLQELYPPLLRDAGVTGTTEMKFVVDAEGNVVPFSIVAVSTTHAEFAAASATVIARMRFSPAMVGGRAVPVLVQIPISWTLERG